MSSWLPLSAGIAFAAIALCAAPPAEQGKAVGGRTGYFLGPEDQIVIHVLESEEISDKPVRIDSAGYIRVPFAGTVHCAGLTVEQLQNELTNQLKKYIRDPQVSVSVVEMRSQPVSVLGAVKTPGVLQIQGQKTLFEILSLAGGLEPKAGNTIKITRKLEWGRIPLPTAHDDSTGQYSIAEVKVKSVLEAKNPAENIQVKPEDVISIPVGETVYAMGEVKKSGGIMLNEKETLSVAEVVALSEGWTNMAAPGRAKILRVIPGTEKRAEIPVDLRAIMEHKQEDLRMKPDDILYVPGNAARSAGLRGIEAAIQIATGVIIWRR